MSALDILNNDRYILFIKGITQQNCIDKNDIVDNIYKNNSDDVFYSYIHDVYDKMPKVFSTLNVWPKSTKIKCWYCMFSFEGEPITIPKNVSYTPNGKIYDIHGTFCSFNCAKAYLDTTNIEQKWEKYEMLKMLYFIFYGKKIKDITPSPNRYDMEQYGGHVSESTYKENLLKINYK